MHNDEPTLQDVLLRNALIREVGEAVATCDPPQLFGVHGDWGMGKTSFLHQVRYYLTEENPQSLVVGDASTQSTKYGDHIQTVWFDAWRYHAEAVPVVALLQEMRAQLSGKPLKGSESKRLREVVVRGAFLGLDEVTKKIGFQYAKFEQASRQWDAENLAATLPSDVLRNNLQDTIQLLLQRGNDEAPAEGDTSRRLVVFVDDLDRCEPEAAYRLLEGLKVYLTLNNCVFVLGLNQRAVEGAIASRLAAGQTDEDARQDAQVRAASYLEKICQNVWHLPIVQAPGQVLCDFVADGGDVLPHHIGWLREVLGVRPCLPPNPRKLKGLANLVARLCSRLPSDLDAGEGARGRIEMRKLLLVAYVHQFHHDLYVRWQANPSLYHAIAGWCRRKAEYDVLRGLALPMESEDAVGGDAESAPPMEPTNPNVSMFPDPTAANVFWIGSIVCDLPEQVAHETFTPYLAAKAP